MIMKAEIPKRWQQFLLVKYNTLGNVVFRKRP
jgi:hypothetical protein